MRNSSALFRRLLPRDRQVSSRIQRGLIATALVLAVLGGGSCTSPDDGDSSSPAADRGLQQEVDAYLQPYVDGKNFSGVVLLAREGEILLNKAYGMASFEESVPNTPSTKFQIASISKSFTAAAVLLLQERGLLEIENPIGRFLPDFPNGETITVHQLLDHTSGLPRLVSLPDFREKSRQPHTAQDLVMWIRDEPLVSEPGKSYAFSNANYAVLAYIIELVSDMSFEEFLETEIFEPLGLQTTGHRGDAAAVIENMASGHVTVGRSDLKPSGEFDYSTGTGTGSLYSTPKDLLEWYMALRGGHLLGSDSLKVIFEDHITSPAYGWVRDTVLDREVIKAEAWDGFGFVTQFVHFPEEQVVVAVFCNLNIRGIATELVKNLSAIVLGEEHETLQLIAEPIYDSALLGELTGLYRHGKEFYTPEATMRIFDTEGYLFVEGNPPGRPAALLQISENAFIHRRHWFRVRFRWNDDGHVVGVRYGQFDAAKQDPN
jgi:CubicO group peptidase (beta-lactamase class C family)